MTEEPKTLLELVKEYGVACAAVAIAQGRDVERAVALLAEIEHRIGLISTLAAGRREYAQSAPEPSRQTLEDEAHTLETALRLLDGDERPMFGLPSWRWTPEMCAKLEATR